MIKSIITYWLVLSTSIVFSQNYTTSKIPWLVFNKNKHKSVNVIDDSGNVIINVPRTYKKNKQEKGRLKWISVNGEDYLIKERKGLEKIFTPEMVHIGTMEESGDRILLFKDAELFTFKTRKFFYSKKSSYVNTDGLDVVSIQDDKGKYLINCNNKIRKESNELLIALVLHQKLERAIRRQRDSDESFLLTDQFLSSTVTCN